MLIKTCMKPNDLIDFLESCNSNLQGWESQSHWMDRRLGVFWAGHFSFWRKVFAFSNSAWLQPCDVENLLMHLSLESTRLVSFRCLVIHFEAKKECDCVHQKVDAMEYALLYLFWLNGDHSHYWSSFFALWYWPNAVKKPANLSTSYQLTSLSSYA